MMERMCGMSDHNNEIQFTAHLQFTVGLQYLLKFSHVTFDKGITVLQFKYRGNITSNFLINILK